MVALSGSSSKVNSVVSFPRSCVLTVREVSERICWRYWIILALSSSGILIHSVRASIDKLLQSDLGKKTRLVFPRPFPLRAWEELEGKRCWRRCCCWLPIKDWFTNNVSIGVSKSWVHTEYPFPSITSSANTSPWLLTCTAGLAPWFRLVAASWISAAFNKARMYSLYGMATSKPAMRRAAPIVVLTACR